MLLVSKREPHSTATLGREATQHSTPRRNKNPITRPREKLSCILQANSTNQENTHTHNLGKISAAKKQNLNHNKKRQKTNTPRKSKSRVKNSPIYFPQPQPPKISHTGNKQTKQIKMESPKRLQIRRLRTRTHSHLQKETSRLPSLSSHLRFRSSSSSAPKPYNATS